MSAHLQFVSTYLRYLCWRYLVLCILCGGDISKLVVLTVSEIYVLLILRIRASSRIGDPEVWSRKVEGHFSISIYTVWRERNGNGVQKGTCMVGSDLARSPHAQLVKRKANCCHKKCSYLLFCLFRRDPVTLIGQVEFTFLVEPNFPSSRIRHAMELLSHQFAKRW